MQNDFKDASYEIRVSGSGVRVYDEERAGLGFSVEGSGFRVGGLGFRVQGLGCSVQGLGFRV